MFLDVTRSLLGCYRFAVALRAPVTLCARTFFLIWIKGAVSADLTKCGLRSYQHVKSLKRRSLLPKEEKSVLRALPLACILFMNVDP